MDQALAVAPRARLSARLVGDDLQPERYHAVLDDLATRHSGVRREPHPRAAARDLLLHSDGHARKLLSRRCAHDRCWRLSGPAGQACLPATVEPVVLVAACLRACPTGGFVQLSHGDWRTGIIGHWPFDLDQAVTLVAHATDDARARSGASC